MALELRIFLLQRLDLLRKLPVLRTLLLVDGDSIVSGNGFLYAGVAAGGYYVTKLIMKRKQA